MNASRTKFLILALSGIGLIGFPLAHGSAEPTCEKACVQGDCKNGKGVQTYAGCDRYEGNFSDGFREGEGSYLFSNGDKYTGNFKKGRRAGKGLYFFAKKPGAEAFSFEANQDELGNGTGVLKNGTTSTDCILLAGIVRCSGEKKLYLSEKAEAAAVVLYSGPGATVDRQGVRSAMSAGDSVMTGDNVISGNENLDLQMKGAVAIRLKPQSELGFSSQSTQALELKQGSAVVRFHKGTGGLQIKAPAANIQADDSTLSIQTDRNSTEVKVFQIEKGNVTVSPRIAELENKTQAQIESDPKLKQLEIQRKKLEVPVQKSSVAVLKSEKPGTIPKTDVKKFEATQKETIENQVLVLADENTIKKLRDNPNDALSKKNMLSSYDAGLEQALGSVEKELGKQPLKNEADIMRVYGLVEYVTLRDGQKLPGAVVTQASDILLVHTIGKVSRIKTSQVSYIDYETRGDKK